MKRMRRLRYQVAVSLDGFIADPEGSADWIPMDPDIDFDALLAQFDTFLMGRRTYETSGRWCPSSGWWWCPRRSIPRRIRA